LNLSLKSSLRCFCLPISPFFEFLTPGSLPSRSFSVTRAWVAANAVLSSSLPLELPASYRSESSDARELGHRFYKCLLSAFSVLFLLLSSSTTRKGECLIVVLNSLWPFSLSTNFLLANIATTLIPPLAFLFVSFLSFSFPISLVDSFAGSLARGLYGFLGDSLGLSAPSPPLLFASLFRAHP